MQELLGRIARLDPSASLGLRVIACFDELIVGNVNTRALLSAAASLAGCTAGFRHDDSGRTERITPRGHTAPPATGAPDAAFLVRADGLSVWLERTPPALANDAIILERLAMAVRIRHGRGRAGTDNRRDLGVLVDGSAAVEERVAAGGALGLTTGRSYRIVAAPLFAVWRDHPVGPEDVVPTAHGPIHVLVVQAHADTVAASPVGVGVAGQVEVLAHSFRTALVALRLCAPPRTGAVRAEEFGGLVDLLADAPEDSHQPDVERLEVVIAHPWGLATVDAIVRSASVRQAARAANVHHSTMQTRLETIEQTLGFDPFEGFGKTRIGMAHLVWRLRHSTVLDLPAPSGLAGVVGASVSGG